MTSEAAILLGTATSLAFIHTIAGPDHYLVITATAKARNWSLLRALRLTCLFGLGHVLSSVVIGSLGILLGIQLIELVAIETARGSLAGWGLIAFGLVYLAWGLRQAGRCGGQSRAGRCEAGQLPEHDCTSDPGRMTPARRRWKPTPWALFVIFAIGPCETLIPLLMYPAAQRNAALAVAVTCVFGVVTIATMLGAVAVSLSGLHRFNFKRMGRFSHAIAGAFVAACGGTVQFAGW